VTEELTNLHPNTNVNWLSILPPTHESQRHKSLNDARELTYIRRACANHLETYDFKWMPNQTKLKAEERYIRRRLKLPEDDICRANEVGEILQRLCTYCGSEEHVSQDCSLATTDPIKCLYEHDGVKVDQPHLILSCPVLHRYCPVCFCRGHDKSVHKNPRFTQSELRARFLRAQPEGIFTCIPLLAKSDKGEKLLKSYHWRLGLMGVTFWKDALSRYYLQIDPRNNTEMNPKPSRDEVALRKSSWRRKFEIVHQNSRLEDPRHAKPVPRFLIRRLDKIEAATRRRERARQAQERVDAARRDRERRRRHSSERRSGSDQSRSSSRAGFSLDRSRSRSRGSQEDRRQHHYEPAERRGLSSCDLRQKLEKADSSGNMIVLTINEGERAVGTRVREETNVSDQRLMETEDDFAHEKDGEEMFDIGAVMTNEETNSD